MNENHCKTLPNQPLMQIPIDSLSHVNENPETACLELDEDPATLEFKD